MKIKAILTRDIRNPLIHRAIINSNEAPVGSDSSAGITDVTVADNCSDNVEIYNVSGARVTSTTLTPGVYVVRKGQDVKKILVK